eukprot:8020219-Alexandrium_andersonii.AAC.1
MAHPRTGRYQTFNESMFWWRLSLMERHRHKAAPPTPNMRVVFEPIVGRPPPPEHAHHYLAGRRL